MIDIINGNMKNPKVIVQIPAYNEEKTIERVIKEIPRKIPGVSEIKVLVIDDCSSDKTSEIAQKAGADKVFRNKNNMGLGTTFKRGIEASLKLGGDIIINIDGDGQFNPKEIPKLLKPILNNGADMVTGSRFLPESVTENIPKAKKWGNKRFSKLISRIKGRESIVKRIMKEGHEVADHSYYHKRMWFKSRKFIEQDIEKSEKELYKLGIKTDLFRFPGLKFGINAIFAYKKAGKKVIFADAISHDWLDPWLKKKYNRDPPINIERPINRIKRKTKNGSILNFHDYLEGIGPNKEVIPILEKTLPYLKNKGYDFVTVSDLLFNQ
jgi:glycosyltransferase involved in cell wall biosynthesis